MYCKPGAARSMALAGCLMAWGCAHRPASPQPERLAVLRFENLGADTALDWEGRALAETITGDLTGVPGLYAIPNSRIRALGLSLGARPAGAPGISTEQTEALGSAANRLGYGEYWTLHGRLEARLTIRDPRAHRAIAVYTASAAAGDVLGVAAALARRISPRAGRYSTSNEQALKEFVQALDGTDRTVREADANLAMAADPNYGPAYRLAAELALPHDRDLALQILDRGMARANGMAAPDRARLEVESAELRRDTAASQTALVKLARLDAGDPAVWRALAETAFNRRDYKQAVEAFQQSLAVEPEDATALNQLGYAEAYAGDLAAGVRALRRYQASRPAEANPLDSLGDIYLVRGRFKEAEDFYQQAVKKDPNFLGGGEWYKAAMARLMTGDVGGADSLARRFLDARSAAHDPSAPLEEAGWQWISGRRKQAYAALEGVAQTAGSGPQRQVASRACSQLAIWSLMLGDRAAAQQMALKAAALADPLTGPEAVVARFLTLGPMTAQEWQQEADKLAPNAAQHGIKEFALAHALLLGKQFGPALEVLRGVYNEGNSTQDESLPVLLAWALIETSDDKDAAPLLEPNPIPAPTGVGPFTSFYFPRLFFLRGELAARQGKADEAKADYKLFVQLSGDWNFEWGEEKKAK